MHQCEVISFRSCGCFPRMRSIWLRKCGQDLWTMSEKSRGELQLFMSRPEGCEQTGRLRNSECAQLRKDIVTKTSSTTESWSTQQKCRLREWRLHQCEVVFFRLCGCFPRMRLWTMSEKSRGELQLFMSRPEGCEQTGRLRNSECAQLTKYIRYKNVQHYRVMEYSTKMQAQGVAAASV